MHSTLKVSDNGVGGNIACESTFSDGFIFHTLSMGKSQMASTNEPNWFIAIQKPDDNQVFML
ncbi:hypothetical protein [Anditalea andensis]|uniref:hypothetical protein n=1 Tax=Anditalea andensis TaxID=1048983 RepID=UPI0013DFAFEE|nr:hypothetical protein [Anditalea andensis]